MDLSKQWSNEGITSNEIILTMMAKSFLLYVLYYIILALIIITMHTHKSNYIKSC